MKKPPKHWVDHIERQIHLELAKDGPVVGLIIPRRVTLYFRGDVLHGVTLNGPWKDRPAATRAYWQNVDFGSVGVPLRAIGAPTSLLPKWVIRLAEKHRPAPVEGRPAEKVTKV